jgi:hypothetical protein
MNSMIRYLILFATLNFILNLDSLSQPSPLPTPSYVLQDRPQTSSTITPPTPTPMQEIKYEAGSQISYSVSGGSSQGSSPIDVDKKIDPEDDQGYSVNDPINMYISIKNMLSYPISDLTIKEETDPSLEIINKSICCMIDPILNSFNERRLKKCLPGDKYPDQKNNNTLFLNISNFGAKKWIRFNYTISPKKEGAFYAYTLVRIGSNTSDYKDLLFSKRINIKYQIYNFKVTPRPDKYQAYQDDNITMAMDVQYISNYPRKGKFYVSIDPNRNDIECVKNRTTELEFNKSLEEKSFTPIIRFKQTGQLPFPNLVVSDASDKFHHILIPLNGSLNIDTPYLRNKPWIDCILQFLAIFAAILGSLELRKRLDRGAKELDRGHNPWFWK